MKHFVVLIALSIVFFSCEKGEFNQPNIIYILADDMGYGDVSALNENSKIITPNIDRIADEGMTFFDAHTNSSVCTPTRYGILTGRYAWRTRMKNGVLQGHSDHLIDMDRETVASFLKKQGYTTAVVGKWHLGMDWTSNDSLEVHAPTGSNVDFSIPAKNGPLDIGFDYYFGISASLNMVPHAYLENRRVLGDLLYLGDKESIKESGINGKYGWWNEDYKQDEVLMDLAAKSVKWIDDQVSDEDNPPFFLYMPLSAPHAPIVPSNKYIDQSGLGSYGDYCLEVDWVVGEILKVLEKHGVEENTLIIFTADNGCSPQAKFEDLQAQGHFPSYIYRGLKGSLYEGGHRVPFLSRWPERIKAGSSSDLTICTTDLLATVADLHETPLSNDAGEDSFSFLDAFSGDTPEWADSRGVVHHSDAGHFAIRKGKWKMIFNEAGGTRRLNPKSQPVINPAAIQLFDMENDPCESTNIQHLHPEIVEELRLLISTYIEQGRSNEGETVENDYSKRGWRQLETLNIN
jgi:arylsulfatase A